MSTNMWSPGLGDRLPDELGEVDHEVDLAPDDSPRGAGGLARPELPGPDAHHIVEPGVALVAAHVAGREDDLAVPRRVGPGEAPPVEDDRRSVLGLDGPLEVRKRVLVGSGAGVVGGLQASGNAALHRPFSDEEVIALAPRLALE